MAYSFKQADLEVFLSNENKEQKILFPKQKGYRKICKENINDKIFLIKNFANTNDDIKILFDDVDFDYFQEYMYLTFVVDGSMRADLNKKSLVYENSKTTIHKSANFSIQSLEIQANTNFSALGILVHNSIMDELNISLTDTLILKHSITKPKLNNLAKNILSLPNLSNLEHLHLQSMALDLVYNELKSLEKKPTKYDVLFLKYDIEALYWAKELLENSDHFIGISELSKKVHLNEFKLKIGFKRYFSLTPYQISIQSRLEKAKTLLQDKELNINEISQKIGFRHPQSFSAAFTRHFGICPKDMRKVKKNIIIH